MKTSRTQRIPSLHEHIERAKFASMLGTTHHDTEHALECAKGTLAALDLTLKHEDLNLIPAAAEGCFERARDLIIDALAQGAREEDFGGAFDFACAWIIEGAAACK